MSCFVLLIDQDVPFSYAGMQLARLTTILRVRQNYHAENAKFILVGTFLHTQV